jgi:hypothetical protein
MVTQRRSREPLEEEARIGKTATLAAQLSRLDLVALDELGYLPSTTAIEGRQPRSLTTRNPHQDRGLADRLSEQRDLPDFA